MGRHDEIGALPLSINRGRFQKQIAFLEKQIQNRYNPVMISALCTTVLGNLVHKADTTTLYSYKTHLWTDRMHIHKIIACMQILLVTTVYEMKNSNSYVHLNSLRKYPTELASPRTQPRAHP